MKVAWVSNSPWCGTGYGQQTALLLPRLAERYGPENVCCISNYGLQGASIVVEGVTHYPQGHTMYSDDIAPVHALQFFAGDNDAWVIGLYDAWCYRNPLWADMNVAWVTPVDHAPLPPHARQALAEMGAIPIAYSRFGVDHLTAAGFDPMYAPHAIDTGVFAPGDKAAARRNIGLPEQAYIVGMVAANKGRTPPRKGWGEAFRGFADFARNHPDAVLYVHSDRLGVVDGVDLETLAMMAGIPEKQIMFVDPYSAAMSLPATVIADIHRACDVHLAPSYGEGFGIPTLEAQACGTPAVVNNFSAQPELLGAGWAVPGQEWWDPMQRSWFQVPSIAGITQSLEAAYERDEDTVRRQAATAADHAAGYDIDVVWDRHWVPLLGELEAACGTVEPLIAEPVA